MRRLWIAIGLIFVLGGVSASGQPAQADPYTLTYLGRVRMPQTDTAFASGGLTIRTHPSGYRELLSLDALGRVYGVRLPMVWDDSIATNRIVYGRPEVPAGHRHWNIGMDHTGELLVFHAPGYPADSPATMPTITRFTITASALTNRRGPYALPGVHFHRRHGGSLILPDAVAAKYGGRKTVIGFGGAYNIVQGGSTGTAAYAVDLNTAATTTILEFPWGNGAQNERRRGDYVNADSGEAALRQPTGPGNFDGYWTHTDTRSGAAWAHGGLWVVGYEATGRMRYGTEAGESGFHADAFKTFLRFYPEVQLDSVRTGQLTPQATRPAYWRLGEIAGVPAWLATQLNVNGTPRINFESKVNGLVVEGDILIVGGPFAWGGQWNEHPALYAFRIGAAGPRPVDCVVSEAVFQSAGPWLPEVCPASGTQTRTEIWTRSVVTPASNGGAACPALIESQPGTQMCTPPQSVPTEFTIPATTITIPARTCRYVSGAWVCTPQ